MESHLCKVFVGNVPFQCNQSEFRECFEKMTGFIKAEIICKPGTDISRGFGFVTFDTPENAKKLIGNESIIFKDRNLRFTEYQITDNIKNIIPETNISSPIDCVLKNKNFIVVKNIKNDMTREDLYNIFSKYCNVGRHFFVTDHDTGKQKSYAVVEILNDSVYDYLIKQKEIKYDSHILELSKWKMQKSNKEKKITKHDLFKAFTAGRSIGMIEAFRVSKPSNNVSHHYFK